MLVICVAPKGASVDKESVESSMVAWVKYAPSSRVLVIGFVRGTVYEFFGVPAAAHRALMSAASKGRQFNRFIKGRYAYERRAAGASWN